MLAPGPNSSPVFFEGTDSRLSFAQSEQVQALSRSVLAVTDYPSLFRIAADFGREIGAGAVNCAVFDNERRKLVGVSSSMNEAAVARYFTENMNRSDPLIQRIFGDPEPALLGWGFGVTEAWQNGDASRMLNAMEMDGYFGLAYFPVPVADGAFSTSITFRSEIEPERGQAYLNEQYGLLQLAASIIGIRAADLFRAGRGGERWYTFDSFDLSPRELQIVRLLALGFGTDDIAVRLNVERASVQMHMTAAGTKLGAQSDEQVVGIAYLRGLI